MKKKPLNLSRRQLLKILGNGGVLAPFAGGLSPLNPIFSNPATAFGQATSKRRILQIFLDGGWDMVLATDPCVGAKTGSGIDPLVWEAPDQHYYERAYHDATATGQYLGETYGDYAPATTVGSGPNASLKVGYGLQETVVNTFARDLGDIGAGGALKLMPACFVNGMFVEVTAHELAVSYMYSGDLSLSRSRENPAFVATMAEQTGGFPAHVVLGQAIPLGDTKLTYPPLLANSGNLLQMMTAGPKLLNPDDPGSDYIPQDASINASTSLIATLNGNFNTRQKANGKASLLPWDNAEGNIQGFYAQNFSSQVDVNDPAVRDRYGLNHVSGSEYAYTYSGGVDEKFASAFLILKSGLSRFCTLNFGGFDTHENHTSQHIPVLQDFSHCLNRLVYDLVNTPDPTDPGKMLSDNTTILISSDFNRTPVFNSANGTDHWRTGTSILLGAGVKPDTVYGRTDNWGYAETPTGAILDTGNGRTRVINSAEPGVLLPDHLAGAILRHLGFTEQADDLTSVDITNELFTS